MSGQSDTIAILGGRGMLGTDVVALCRSRGVETKVFDLPEFNISDEKQLADAIQGSGAVVNCAAYTNVDGAESEAELAYKVNGQAVGKLGEIAKSRGLWVLHISTDFVFDGQSDRAYIESDEPNPLGSYGRSKLAGEQLLVESGASSCIMRVQWTYGSAGNNFVYKLVSLAREGKSLRVVDDQIGSPTATVEVAKVICELLGKRPEGLFHYASSGHVSRYDMAKYMFEKLGIAAELSACKSSEYKSPAARPLNSRFDCSKISGILDSPIRGWQVGLDEFLSEL